MMKYHSKKPSIQTSLIALPVLFKELFKGNFPLLKYYIKNGIMNRIEFSFPDQEMLSFFEKLPYTDSVDNTYLDLNEKIAIMTYDDVYDQDICDYEEKIGMKSTFFLLSYRINKKIVTSHSDLQLHFDKRYGPISEQIDIIKKMTGKSPFINRNHTLWWDYNHFDLLFLALNGMKIDSTLAGTKPFRLCFNGKILPIWEVPFSVCDATGISSATANTAGNMESLFKKDITPIVGLFHPENKDTSSWKDFYSYAKKYDYKVLTMKNFYDTYLEKS